MQIFTGKTSKENLQWLIKIITNVVSVKPEVEELVHFMEHNYDSHSATVTHRITKEEILKPERRQGARITFGSDIVSALEPHLGSVFKQVNEQSSSSDMEFIVEPSHGDLLYYRKGGDFKWHRDSIPDKVPTKEHKFYTLLIGLNHKQCVGGATQVVNPVTKKIYTYPQSATFGEWVLFPSDELHSGSEVMEGYKMTLKLDIWIKFGPTEVNPLLQLVPYERKVDYTSKLSSVTQLKLVVDAMKIIGNGELYDLMMKYFNKGLPDFYQHFPMDMLMSDIREIGIFWISPNTNPQQLTNYFRMFQLYDEYNIITPPAFNHIEVWARLREPAGSQEIDRWYQEQYYYEDYEDDDFCNGYD